jgi:metallo-beta-lactamase family protein
MFLLETEAGNLLVDCGLFQGRRQESFEKNRKLPSPVYRANAACLTHAHIDHSGALPSLVKSGWDGPIFTTPATGDLCGYMLRDAAYIQESDTGWLNRKHRDDPHWVDLEPLYTQADALQALKQLVTYHYWRSFEPMPGMRVVLSDAGHVLGSASVLVEAEGKRVLFSGDIGRRNIPILRDPEVPANADFVVMESTYGDREHAPIEESRHELGRIIRETAARNGKIIIPSFALERTQEVVYAIHRLLQDDLIPDIPIYVDSPLAVNLTQVFRIHPECYDEDVLAWLAEHGDPWGFESVRYTTTKEESMALNTAEGPMVIISASGMCEAGRILHHLRNSIGSRNNTVVIVGFQAEHTLGRRLVERRSQVRIFGVKQEVHARVEVLNGFSAHADRTGLLDFARLAGDDVEQYFLVHGEPPAQQALAEELRRRRGDRVTIPSRGQIVTL